MGPVAELRIGTTVATIGGDAGSLIGVLNKTIEDGRNKKERPKK